MKIYILILITHLIVAIFAKNGRRVSHEDNDPISFDSKKSIDIPSTYSAIATKNLTTEEIPMEDSLRPVNLTNLELDRIRTENGNVCFANAINESKDLVLKYPFQAAASGTDVSLNKSTVNKLERMVERYGGACTLAILRLHETRLPIVSYELKYRSSENSTSLNEIFGTKQDVRWSEIGEKIKLEYGDHCLLGFFHTTRILSKSHSDEKAYAWNIDRNNLKKLEIIHGTECIAAVIKLLAIQRSDDYVNEGGTNTHVVRGKKGESGETTSETKNDTLEIPEDFRTKFGKSCVLLVPKLVKLMESRHTSSRKKSFYQKITVNLAKERYLRRRDFEELSATYGRKCLRASADLLDMRIEEKGEGKKTNYYVVPSSMRNDLVWPFYGTRHQSDKMAFVHGTKCAMALYELGKRHPTDNGTLDNVSITRRAYLRIDSTGYSELKKKYGNDCSLALVTLLDIDVMNSTELRSMMRKSVLDEGRIVPLSTSDNTEGSYTTKNQPIDGKSRQFVKRSARTKRNEHFEQEKIELERITLQFRKLDVKKQEKVCRFIEKGPRQKVFFGVVRKLLRKSIVNSGEESGVHFDHKRGYELSMRNRRDREILILGWACDDRRPNQDILYQNFRRAISIKNPIEEENKVESAMNEDEESIDVPVRLDDLLEIDKIKTRQVSQEPLESDKGEEEVSQSESLGM